MSNIQKTIVLLIISLTFVSGCSEMVGTKSENSEPESFIKTLQKEYESSDITEVLQKNYNIDWSVYNSSFSKVLGGTYHEFSVNSNRVDREFKGSPLTYKVLAVEGDDSYSFFVLKFLEKGNTKTPGLSWGGFADFTGQMFLLDESDNMVIASRYENGKYAGKLNPLTEKEAHSVNGKRKLSVDCYVEETQH